MLDTMLADVAFPWRAAVWVEKVSDGGQGLHVRARMTADSANCRGCGRASSRVHARYQRRVADLPAGGRRVTIYLPVLGFGARPGGARTWRSAWCTGRCSGDQFFANVIKRVETGEPLSPVQQLVDPRIVLSLPGLVRPLSRGWVKLAGTDPAAYPLVHPNYFGERADLDRMTMMVRMARDIHATKAFTGGWQISELAPGPKVASDAELAAW